MISYFLLQDKMTTDAVYKYMKTQNRPYSANDIASALDKDKHAKNAIQKSLDKLVDNGKFFMKVSKHFEFIRIIIKTFMYLNIY
jgi:predicted transcriptional regulator